jgi:hypothetical protein
VRILSDKLSNVRCRMQKRVLSKLETSRIAARVPRNLAAGACNGFVYFAESRCSGFSTDRPIRQMDRLVSEAAFFITDFHLATGREILFGEAHYKRLIHRDINRLSVYLDHEYRVKLAAIGLDLKHRFLSREFKLVWSHGDYKIENILFNERDLKITGVIDWDLSRIEGFPLVDVFYLLLYKASLFTGKMVFDIYRERYLMLNFDESEKNIIYAYLDALRIPKDHISPLLIIFWINCVTQRYCQMLDADSPLKHKWFSAEVLGTIDLISGLIAKGEEKA